MRRTGKYWALTVVSNMMAVMSSLAVLLWNDDTNQFGLWFDSESILVKCLSYC
jgi:hypothetical protein